MCAATSTLSRPKARPCTCKGYGFPHRGGPKCFGRDAGPFCGECGKPCEAKEEDFGYGPLEAWGQRFTHRDVQTVSSCCEAPVYADASLTIEYP